MNDVIGYDVSVCGQEVFCVECLGKIYLEGCMQILVFDGLDLSVNIGEMVVIIGVFGVGKSILLYLFGGLDLFMVGEVLVVGVCMLQFFDVVCGSLCNCMLGFVYQFYYLLFEFIVLENVMMLVLLGGVDVVDVQVCVCLLLELVGLGYCLEYKFSELFGGECQCVVVVCVLVNWLVCVLGDEFIGNLDDKIVVIVFDLMLEFNCVYYISLVLVIYDCSLVCKLDCVLELCEGCLYVLLYDQV